MKFSIESSDNGFSLVWTSDCEPRSLVAAHPGHDVLAIVGENTTELLLRRDDEEWRPVQIGRDKYNAQATLNEISADLNPSVQQKLRRFLNFRAEDLFKDEFDDEEIGGFASWLFEKLKRPEQFLQEISNRFITSKRFAAREGEAIRQFIENTRGRFPAEYVALASFATHSSALIAAAIWATSDKSGPLLLYISAIGVSGITPTLPMNVITRDYIRSAELQRQIAAKLSVDIQRVAEVYEIWCSTASAVREAPTMDGFLDAEDAEYFLQACVTYFSEADRDVRAFERVIPGQVVAPVQFEVDEGALDIADAGWSDQQLVEARGAARGLANILGDISVASSFGNILPLFDRKCQRIIMLLKEVSSGAHDAGRVIEIGLEINSLASYVELSDAKIGDSTLELLSTFMQPALAFVEQFPEWRSYNHSLSKSRLPALGLGVTAGAQLLKESINDASILTERACARVQELVEGLDTQTSDLDEKEGLARAGENLASALSKQATKAIAAEAEGATQEAIHALRAETQNAAVRWIVKHGPALVDFAKERHLYWLVKFVDFFNN